MKGRLINIPTYLFFFLFFCVYGVTNLYVGWRAWQTLAHVLPAGSAIFYWLTLSFFALAYLASRVGQKWLPEPAYTLLTYVGAYWLAIVYYGFLFTAAADIIRLLNQVVPVLPVFFKHRPHVPGLFIMFLVASILAYGTWNARHPIINRYNIDIPKAGGNLTQLHVVAVSDIHLGNIIGVSRLKELVSSINRLNPDIVLLVGDVVDAELHPFVAQNMGQVLRQLKPRLGVHAVLGNHEYIGREADAIISALEQSGVNILRDRKLFIDNSFILAGRDEHSAHRYGSKQRLTLSAILAGTDPSVPILLLDHQPVDLAEAQVANVDLQLSGHTHRGQLFPNHLITSAIYEVDWGYLKKDSLQIIVSSGYGTWGPPIRTGNQPELLDIYITFGAPKTH